MGEGLKPFWSALQQSGVVNILKCFVWSEGERKFMPVSLKRFWGVPTGTRIKIAYDVLDRSKCHFVCGSWLSAYVYQTVLDQLRRNGGPSEIFTELHFRAPGEMVRFDVIGWSGDALFCIECKSGSFAAKEDRIEQFKETLALTQAVFGQVLPPNIEYKFYLVFDPQLNEDAVVRETLQECGVIALPITELRREFYPKVDLAAAE